MLKTGASVVCLLLILLSLPGVQGICPPETECFGHGKVYDKTAQTCTCDTIPRTGQYTGECCESIGCNPNATCKHGYCGPDGLTCKKCQTGWNGTNCEKVTSCFPWFPCKRGTCIKSRSKCECEPGWVGDLCDRSLCQVPCKFGACPNDPKKCECYENYFGPVCDRSICADGWECQNGGYCIDLHHCVCPPHYSGTYCETISECSVLCEHGRCPNKPDECECESSWGPPGNCSIYGGPCLNCSSVGGTCKKGPNTCECKPGYMGPQCSVQTCDGCMHGRCYRGEHGKSCACDYGWLNEGPVPGFDPTHGPCTKVRYCVTPCVHGSCPNDPYVCECAPPYVGAECDTIRCPHCCPPQTCDCSDPNNIKCRSNWHHDCCLVKSCFRGDTLVHTAKGMVPIESIKEGDMVVTRHEGDGPSVTHLRRVDQVRKQFVPIRDLVVFRMGDEDIWVTPDHMFFETGTGSWIGAANVTTSHSLQGLKGKMVKLQHQLKASQLLDSSGENSVVAVYDLSVHEYDRYSVGKDGLLVSACNDSNDLTTRDQQVWGEVLHPTFLGGPRDGKQTVEAERALTSDNENSDTTSSSSRLSLAAVFGGALGVICLVLVVIVIMKKKPKRRRGEMRLLVEDS